MATEAEVDGMLELAKALGFGGEDDGSGIVRMIDTLCGGDGSGAVVARYAAEKGVGDDRPVQPFKKLLVGDDAVSNLSDAVHGWITNILAMPESNRFTLYSAFYAGMLHERGYRPGDDPDAPPPAR